MKFLCFATLCACSHTTLVDHREDAPDLLGGPPTPDASIHVDIDGVPRAFSDATIVSTRSSPAADSTLGAIIWAEGGEEVIQLRMGDVSPGVHHCGSVDGSWVTLSPKADPAWSRRLVAWDDGECVLTIERAGTHAGDRLVGAFMADLVALSDEQPFVRHRLTNGHFDVTLVADTPN